MRNAILEFLWVNTLLAALDFRANHSIIDRKLAVSVYLRMGLITLILGLSQNLVPHSRLVRERGRKAKF